MRGFAGGHVSVLLRQAPIGFPPSSPRGLLLLCDQVCKLRAACLHFGFSFEEGDDRMRPRAL